MIDELHVQLVALYHWHPGYVWEHVGLFDGIEYLREGMRKIARTAQLQGAVLLSPLMPSGARGNLDRFIAALDPDEEVVSLADKWGEPTAVEVDALEARQRAWLKARGIHGPV